MAYTGSKEWNNEMVRKYHGGGTRFERGFFLKRWMETYLIRRLVDYAQIKSGEKVIDLGCGEGFLLRELPDNCNATGLDFSPVALARAQEILAGKNIKLLEGDACDTGLTENSFDCVFLSEVLEHLPEPGKAIKEAYRILRENGRVIIGVPDEDRIEKFLILSQKIGVGKALGGVSITWDERGKPRNEWHLQRSNEDFVRKLCAGASFEIRKLEHFPWPLGLRVICVAKK